MKNFVFITLFSLVFSFCTSATAQETPVIVNPQTGAGVNFTRAYWNANVDIANKRIQCDFYSFNSESGVFEKGEDKNSNPQFFESHGFNTQFFHPPLSSDTTTPVNFARVVFERFDDARRHYDRHLILPFWTVIDGVYRGPAPFSTSEFVETFPFNSLVDNAVRVWFQNQTYPSYSICYDLDGLPLLPTGTDGSSNTQFVALPDFTIDIPNTDESFPEIINQETGETVQLVRARWSYNKDIAGSIIYCSVWNFRYQSQIYSHESDTGRTTAYYPYEGGESVQVSTRADIDQRNFWVNDLSANSTFFLAGTWNGGNYIELTQDGYRVWPDSSGNSFSNCKVEFSDSDGENLSFGPTEILPLMSGESTLATNDNSPVGTEDGSVEVTDNCDYTDADEYDGWGFDPVTMASCPPLDSTVNNIEDIAVGSSQVNVSNDIDTIPVDESTSSSSNEETALDNVETTTTESTENSTGNGSAISTDQDSLSENTPQGGGGSFWFPLLIFALGMKYRLTYSNDLQLEFRGGSQ